jgi:hypothetical protein
MFNEVASGPDATSSSTDTDKEGIVYSYYNHYVGQDTPSGNAYADWGSSIKYIRDYGYYYSDGTNLNTPPTSLDTVNPLDNRTTGETDGRPPSLMSESLAWRESFMNADITFQTTGQKTLVGTDYADWLVGGSGNDVIWGRANTNANADGSDNHTVYLQARMFQPNQPTSVLPDDKFNVTDILVGGDGDDTIFTHNRDAEQSSLEKTTFRGAGALVFAGRGSDAIFSGYGSDSIFLSTVNGLNQLDPRNGTLLPPSLNHDSSVITSTQLIMMDNSLDSPADVLYDNAGTQKSDKLPGQHKILTTDLPQSNEVGEGEPSRPDLDETAIYKQMTSDESPDTIYYFPESLGDRTGDVIYNFDVKKDKIDLSSVFQTYMPEIIKMEDAMKQLRITDTRFTGLSGSGTASDPTEPSVGSLKVELFVKASPDHPTSKIYTVAELAGVTLADLIGNSDQDQSTGSTTTTTTTEYENNPFVLISPLAGIDDPSSTST